MKTNLGQIRIIAGKWRSRKINFITSEEVRPTPDRIRETLFNWLGTRILGAKCLDCFAGSGALGFEALSRGAESVTFFDKSPKVTKNIQANAVILGASNIDIRLKFPPNDNTIHLPTFDIVFLDPPFHKNLIHTSCAWLRENEVLKEGSIIYIETERNLKILPIPKEWTILKSETAGQVRYYLVEAHF